MQALSEYGACRCDLTLSVRSKPINRYNIAAWMPFKYIKDGSLGVYVQRDSPGNAKEANWLPAAKDEFSLTSKRGKAKGVTGLVAHSMLTIFPVIAFAAGTVRVIVSLSCRSTWVGRTTGLAPPATDNSTRRGREVLGS